MSGSTLPDDLCRCRDADCPDHARCLRWIQRDMGGQRLVSADSLFPFTELSVVTDPCPSLIEAGQEVVA
jgi:hypothetical protein